MRGNISTLGMLTIQRGKIIKPQLLFPDRTVEVITGLLAEQIKSYVEN